jgi:hypothetical protein
MKPVDRVAVAEKLHALLESTTLMRCVSKPVGSAHHGVIAFPASDTDEQVAQQVAYMDTQQVAPRALVAAVVEPMNMTVLLQNMKPDMATMAAKLAEDAWLHGGGTLPETRSPQDPLIVIARLEGTL